MILKHLYQNKKPGIYYILNIVNNKIYIGSAKNLYDRLQGHNSLLTRNKHTNAHLQNAWNKYGKDNFTCGILENCTINKLTEREQYYININKNLYNITKNVLRLQHSLESKKKMSNTWKKLYSQNTKPHHCVEIYQYIIKDNIYIKWNSIKECSKKIKVSEPSIYRCLKNNNKIIKGFKFYRNIDLLKQGELLETPTVYDRDNQQPSLDSNILEGSTTNSQIQTDNTEDSNGNTSALPIKYSYNKPLIDMMEDIERRLIYGDDIV